MVWTAGVEQLGSIRSVLRAAVRARQCICNAVSRELGRESRIWELNADCKPRINRARQLISTACSKAVGDTNAQMSRQTNHQIKGNNLAEKSQIFSIFRFLSFLFFYRFFFLFLFTFFSFPYAHKAWNTENINTQVLT